MLNSLSLEREKEVGHVFLNADFNKLLSKSTKKLYLEILDNISKFLNIKYWILDN